MAWGLLKELQQLRKGISLIEDFSVQTNQFFTGMLITLSMGMIKKIEVT